MALLERIEREKSAKVLTRSFFRNPVQTRSDSLKALKERVRERMATELPRELLSVAPEEDAPLRKEVDRILTAVVQEGVHNVQQLRRDEFMEELLNEVVGFGPITPLLLDDTVSEVMVNGPGQVWVERNGRLEMTDITFGNSEEIVQVIERMVAPIGRRIDESSPMVDARLPDGSRVNAIIPPLALKGPSINIRKFARDPFTVDDLIRFGTMTPGIAALLEACVRGRLNVLVSGGTGSGKTTTLNVLSSFIPPDERVVTIEDSAELQLRQEHVVTLESRPPNIEGRGQVTIRDLVRNSLRMRPDRIVVGEVRGGEALDMLQAMNTGHDGCLTTCHSNSPRDTLARLETMTLMAGMELPLKAIRTQVASAIDLIVHQTRFRDGSRRITHITEVSGMEGDSVTLQDVCLFEQTGVDSLGRITGRHKPTGLRPRFVDTLEANGVSIPAGVLS